jgi:Co/Zn/Cd efflux system component
MKCQNDVCGFYDFWQIKINSELYGYVLQPTWVLVDPICTFLFSVLVLITTFAIIKDTMLVLMEGKH